MMLVTLGSLVWAAQAESARRLIANEEELSARNLYESYVSQIAAHRFSRRPGQRIESLKAIQKVALMKGPFKPTREEVLNLRSDAIAALGLIDIELVHAEELAVRDWWMTLDEKADLMAFVDRSPYLTVRSRKDGSSLDLPIKIPAYARSSRKFTHHGRFLVVVDENDGGSVWDIRSNRRHLQFQTARALPGQFDCHGSTLAFVDQQRRVQLIDLESSDWLLEIPVKARSLAFSMDGNQLAVGLETESRIKIYQANTGELVTTLTEWKRDELCWSPDGQLLVCAQDKDYWMAVWNVQTRTRCPMLRGHKNGGNECAFNESGKVLVSTGWDGLARFWHPLHRDELLISEGKRCQFHDGDLLTLYTPRRATTWKLHESLECKIFIAADRNLGSDRFTDCVFLEPHGLLAASRLDGVRIWDVESDREVAFLPIDFVDSIAYDAISSSLFTKGKWGVLQWQLRFGPEENVWQLGPPRRLIEARRGQAGADNLTIAPNAAKIATTAGAHGLAVVDLDGAATVNRLGEQRNVHSIALDPDGCCVASTPNFGKGLKIWDANTGELIRELWPECFGASVAYSPQGDHLAVCGDSRIRIYVSASWEVAHEIENDHGPTFIQWSPDGKRLACCNDPNVAILLDMETGQELASFHPPIEAGNIEAIEFSQKEDKLAVVYRNAVACWDLRRVRDELSAMGLDWEAPPVAPRDARDLSCLTIQVDYGQFAAWIE
jgi:WD40 repeat protein